MCNVCAGGVLCVCMCLIVCLCVCICICMCHMHVPIYVCMHACATFTCGMHTESVACKGDYMVLPYAVKARCNPVSL